MNKKILALMFGVILLTGIASAGLFDFLKSDDPEPIPSWETMNITNDFNIKKNSMDAAELCLVTTDKDLLEKLCEKDKDKDKDITETNYFYENSMGVVRFEN